MKNQMEFIKDNTIKLDKDMNDLDKFVFRFIDIIKKHVDYVIISGYISILFGRARGTEDIDIFIRGMDFDKVKILYDELLKNGYWCLNSGDIKEIYEYLSDSLAVRFALANQTIPNFEVKFALSQLNKETFNDKLVVKTSLGDIIISSLERQVAFKRFYLKSDKDIEDARHIENLFKGDIDKGKIEMYKRMLKDAKT